MRQRIAIRAGSEPTSLVNWLSSEVSKFQFDVVNLEHLAHGIRQAHVEAGLGNILSKP
jgi:hypothetical protein